MSKRLWLCITAAALLLPIAAAADISGKWKAEFTSPDGTPRTNTFTFKVEGTKLTGTVAGSQDETPDPERHGQRRRSLLHGRTAVRQVHLQRESHR